MVPIGPIHPVEPVTPKYVSDLVIVMDPPDWIYLLYSGT